MGTLGSCELVPNLTQPIQSSNNFPNVCTAAFSVRLHLRLYPRDLNVSITAISPVLQHLNSNIFPTQENFQFHLSHFGERSTLDLTLHHKKVVVLFSWLEKRGIIIINVLPLPFSKLHFTQLFKFPVHAPWLECCSCLLSRFILFPSSVYCRLTVNNCCRFSTIKKILWS